MSAGSEGIECCQCSSQRLSHHRNENRNGLPDAGRPFCCLWSIPVAYALDSPTSSFGQNRVLGFRPNPVFQLR